MENKTIKAILLTNNQTLISQIDEVAASVPGEPDCKLTNPFVLVEGGNARIMDARCH